MRNSTKPLRTMKENAANKRDSQTDKKTGNYYKTIS